MEPLAKHTTQAVDARKVHVRELANIAYGAASSSKGKQNGALFMALARAAVAEQRMRDFSSQELANTAWAFATVGHQREQLFASLAAAAEQRMWELKSQAVANTAWAFATVGHQEEQLFTSLAAAAEWPMWEFNSQELANTA